MVAASLACLVLETSITAAAEGSPATLRLHKLEMLMGFSRSGQLTVPLFA
jgi:hypothetical protein